MTHSPVRDVEPRVAGVSDAADGQQLDHVLVVSAEPRNLKKEIKHESCGKKEEKKKVHRAP